VQGLNKRFETNYVAVRFGNVLGSAGFSRADLP
jgi:FlaA1/EpsC-like NDP-sugar epimerase